MARVIDPRTAAIQYNFHVSRNQQGSSCFQGFCAKRLLGWGLESCEDVLPRVASYPAATRVERQSQMQACPRPLVMRAPALWEIVQSLLVPR